MVALRVMLDGQLGRSGMPSRERADDEVVRPADHSFELIKESQLPPEISAVYAETWPEGPTGYGPVVLKEIEMRTFSHDGGAEYKKIFEAPERGHEVVCVVNTRNPLAGDKESSVRTINGERKFVKTGLYAPLALASE